VYVGRPALGRGYSPHSSTALDRECYLLPAKAHAYTTLVQRTEFGHNYKLGYKYQCIFTKSGSCLHHATLRTLAVTFAKGNLYQFMRTATDDNNNLPTPNLVD